jgi:hypothetical protein
VQPSRGSALVFLMRHIDLSKVSLTSLERVQKTKSGNEQSLGICHPAETRRSLDLTRVEPHHLVVGRVQAVFSLAESGYEGHEGRLRSFPSPTMQIPRVAQSVLHEGEQILNGFGKRPPRMASVARGDQTPSLLPKAGYPRRPASGAGLARRATWRSTNEPRFRLMWCDALAQASRFSAARDENAAVVLLTVSKDMLVVRVKLVECGLRSWPGEDMAGQLSCCAR